MTESKVRDYGRYVCIMEMAEIMGRQIAVCNGIRCHGGTGCRRSVPGTYSRILNRNSGNDFFPFCQRAYKNLCRAFQKYPVDTAGYVFLLRMCLRRHQNIDTDSRYRRTWHLFRCIYSRDRTRRSECGTERTV